MRERKLTDEQRAVVDHGDGPMRVLGGFGAGKTTALAARTDALVRRGRAVVEIVGDTAALAARIVERHASRRRVLTSDEVVDVVARLLASESEREWPVLHAELGDPAFAREVARTVMRYEASFLGAEELFVHAEAAGEFERWEELARFTDRYLAHLARAGVMDAAGALVAASLLLRSPEVLAAERARFTDVLVDDYQLTNFAIARLITQLVGRGGNVTVFGNPDAAIGSAMGMDGKYLAEFPKRFGLDPAHDIRLTVPLRRPAPPALRIADPGDADRVIASIVASASADTGGDAMVVTRATVPDAVGRESSTVVVAGATDGAWPTVRPRARWFDPMLFSGPDVPDDEARDDAWLAEERRRFLIATSRATRFTVVVAEPPVTRFVADLVG